MSDTTAERGPRTDETQVTALTEQLALLAHWQAAESRIYPLVMADPDLFEAALALVGAAAELMRGEIRTFDDLQRLDAEDILARCSETARAREMGVEVTAAVDAARAMRWREISREVTAHLK